MGLIKWANSKLEGYTFWDIGFVKLSVAACALMVAKLWDGILYLDWYWYLVIFVLAAIKPMYKMFKK